MSNPFKKSIMGSETNPLVNALDGASITNNTTKTKKPIATQFSGITDLATTAFGHISDIIQNSQLDTLPNHTNFNTDSINTFSDLYNMSGPNYSNNQYKLNAKDLAFDFLKKTGEGAAAGSSFGPWGILGGAIGGSLAANVNAIVQAATAKNNKRRQDMYNNLEAFNYNRAYDVGFHNVLSQNQKQQGMDRLFHNVNIGAMGGQLDGPELAGVTTFNVGGTHETNPNGGIPQGIGDNGNQNLVEEGEVKWKDFIFSKRIKPDETILKQHNSFFKGGVMSYADAANKILDMHKERENNPFDIATLNVQMQRLADAQEYQKLAEEAAQYGLLPEEYAQYQQQITSQNTFAKGGKILYYDALKHEIVDKQPNHDRWVPIQSGKTGKNYNGLYDYNSPFYANFWNSLTPNEQRIMKDQFKDWYFSEEYTPAYQFGTQTRYNKWPNENITADELYNQATNNTWGSVHQAWVDWMLRAMDGKYVVPEPKTVSSSNDLKLPDIKNRVNLPEQILNADLGLKSSKKANHPFYLDLLRAAPVFGNLHSILTQNAPDYTYANQLKSLYRPEIYYPQGRYQRYIPVDQYYLATQANQQGNTQYGFYRNNAQSQSAADYYATLASTVANRAIMQNYLQALQQNNQNYNSAVAANNTVDFQNETNRVNTQRTNNSNYANIMGNAYTAAEQERLAVENARESNMQNLALNLGDLGRELYDRWRINNDPSLSYTTGWKYKQVIPLLNMWADMMNEYNKATKSNQTV